MLHKQSDLKHLTECGIEITAFQNDKRSLPYAQAKHGVMAQAVAVIAILVSRGDLIDALFEDVVQGMADVARMPGIVDGCAHALGETDLAINALE